METYYEGLRCPQCHRNFPLRPLKPRLLSLTNVCYSLDCPYCGSETWRQGLIMLETDETYTPEAVEIATGAIRALDPETCRGLVDGH